MPTPGNERTRAERPTEGSKGIVPLAPSAVKGGKHQMRSQLRRAAADLDQTREGFWMIRHYGDHENMAIIVDSLINTEAVQDTIRMIDNRQQAAQRKAKRQQRAQRRHRAPSRQTQPTNSASTAAIDKWAEMTVTLVRKLQQRPGPVAQKALVRLYANANRLYTTDGRQTADFNTGE